MTARELARRALSRVSAGEFASHALDGELVAANLDDRDRALATELVYGVLRYRSRLQRALAARARRGLGKSKKDVRLALELAAYQLIFLDRVPAHAAVNDAVSAVSRRGKAVQGFVNGVLRALERQGEPELPVPSAESAPVHFAMPEELQTELVRALPPGSDVFEATGALNQRAPLWLRPNSERASPEEVAGTVAGATVHPTGAVRVDSQGSPDGLPGWEDGHFTVQDLAAQWIGLMAAPARGATVLDACAGVGGKTTHLAELVGAEGRVHAADLSAGKLAALDRTAARLGLADRIEPMICDLTGSCERLAWDYDVVVIDAPCTGIGVMRRHPEIKWRDWRARQGELVAIQRSLLEALAPRVAAGGALVYAVCSFRAEEGVDQLDAFLAAHSDFELDELVLPGVPVGRQRPGCLHSWPHLDDADAFFAVRLVRRS